jgi:hypothetical protein
VPLFSAVSWAALSPVSWAVASFDLKGLGAGDAAVAAALTLNCDPDLAKMVALTTPPKIIDATTTDPNMRLRVLFMHQSSGRKLTTGLESGVNLRPPRLDTAVETHLALT